MTDQEFDQLKAQEDALWQQIQQRKEESRPLESEWSRIYNARKREELRREILGEIVKVEPEAK